MIIKWPDRGRRRSYWKNIFVGLDQGIGTWFGIDADETISSYVGRNYYNKWQMKAIDWLFKFILNEDNHCLNNIEQRYL